MLLARKPAVLKVPYFQNGRLKISPVFKMNFSCPLFWAQAALGMQQLLSTKI